MPANILTYPDAVVFCGPRWTLDGEKDTLIDATVIVEVLSPSTRNYARGEKFRFYGGLPLFTEYLLAQDEIQVYTSGRVPGLTFPRGFRDPLRFARAVHMHIAMI
jgi:Uma2 family endonuclease